MNRQHRALGALAAAAILGLNTAAVRSWTQSWFEVVELPPTEDFGGAFKR